MDEKVTPKVSPLGNFFTAHSFEMRRAIAMGENDFDMMDQDANMDGRWPSISTSMQTTNRRKVRRLAKPVSVSSCDRAIVGGVLV